MPERDFPLNAWYAAAWQHEIGRSLTARTICGKDLVLYRRTDGGLAALEDACWHRLMPLSLGRLDGDQVVCGYHGLAFNAAGRCTHMPAQQTINPSACVRAYPAVERHRLAWVWPGDPALADPDAIPDFHWNDGAGLAGEGGTYYGLKCNYRLIIDNLMDLTHETYVHAGSIGDDAITGAPFDVTHTARAVTVTRWMLGIEPPPFWARQLGKPGLVDRWQVITFQAPCVVVGDVGVAPVNTGAQAGDRSQGVNGFFLAVLVPRPSAPATTSGTSSAASAPATRRSPGASSSPTSTPKARAYTTRTPPCWKRSSGRSSATRGCRSTTSTSTLGRFGRTA